MSKRKIAFYIESMAVGGAEKVLIDLVNNLDKEKFDVTLISIFKNSIYEEYKHEISQEVVLNVQYKWLIDNSNKLRYLIFNFLYNKIPVKHMYRWFIKDKYDIEVAFYEGSPTYFVSGSNQSSKKIAWLHTLQDRLYKNAPREQLAKQRDIYAKYDKVIGVSKNSSKSFNKYFEDIQVDTVHNSLDIGNIYERSQEGTDLGKVDKLKLVSVGRLTPLKGHARLLHVLGKLKKEGFQFHLSIVGDGHIRDEIVGNIKENNLEQDVKMYGFQTNPFKYIKDSDCLVCSSTVEGLSLVVIESLLLHTPVVTTDCGGMDEIIEQNKNGIICENSEAGLYAAIKEVLQNPERLNEFRQYTLDRKQETEYQYSVDRFNDFFTNI